MNSVSETNRDDVDWAPAAEQSSEDDEAQTGNVLASEDEASDSAEHEALHVVADDGTEIDLDAVLDAMAEAVDPEADRAVDEALEVDSEDEAEAALEAVEDEEDETSVDPYEEFRAELRSKLGKWYVIHSYAGFERRVKSNIENRMVSMNMEDYIYEVQVPMEDVVEIKNGQRKMVNRVRIPGYVLVRMDLNEDSWSVVRHTPGVTGFVGNAHNPTPLRFEEAFSMLKSLVQVEAAPAKGAAKGQKAAARVIPAEVDFEIGETITIKEGSFAGLPGSISEIKPESGKLTVLVSLFERETPVELSFDQVTKL
ncbi:transcription antitermination protein nusG [Leifsonia sp. 98AMF]|nr:transcription antitermination protein nusG [Leifsonia sp. 197AMF]SDJ26854.1 transcription antitermination protein nusG [Leifsonia sp. 466MF]SDK54951.1 transcription antitermination protein nusG [Leifsonia sp. 157MF]SDN48849.1 transcription antitermination protein nusG [Leifsonia sp. 509MF]SEN61770.1 transcription antitermination protein nusG [Leifsonia sp. 467MF]SFM64924.1 transcription antitermination protein nusG [Leifsonia sp. 98AMF]